MCGCVKDKSSLPSSTSQMTPVALEMTIMVVVPEGRGTGAPEVGALLMTSTFPERGMQGLGRRGHQKKHDLGSRGGGLLRRTPGREIPLLRAGGEGLGRGTPAHPSGRRE